MISWFSNNIHIFSFYLFSISGFTYDKELTLEVQNVIAPPKPKSALIREKLNSSMNNGTVKSPSKADDKSELPSSGERIPENNSPNGHNMEQIGRSPPDSPAGSNAVMSPSNESHDRRTIDTNVNGSPHAFDTQR